MNQVLSDERLARLLSRAETLLWLHLGKSHGPIPSLQIYISIHLFR